MDAYIADTVRTPRGKAKASGGLGQVKPLDLLTTLFHALETRQPFDTNAIDDVILGCATQTGEQGGNIAKVAALMAGWGDHIPGLTVNRYCASGLEAVNLAAAKIHSGVDQLIVAGGVESVSRVPMFADKGPLYTDPAVIQKAGFIHMGIAADLIATLEGFSRAELDAYAVRTHRRAAYAQANGHFTPALIPIHDSEGRLLLDHDEHIRPDTTPEQLAEMEPAFATMGAEGMDAQALARYPQLPAIHHLHHRGNSPALADGAGAVIVGSKERLAELGLRPRARILAIASHSVDPITMLTAGQIAAAKAIHRANLTPAQVDLFEFAEAFSALCLKFQRDFDVAPERFNANGGTIAMGHAFGATGAILLTTLLSELERQDKQIGLVAVSGAAGLGVATLIARL